jgi:hypothetical protein
MPHIPVLNFLSNKFEITSQGLTTIVNAAPIVPDQIFVLKGRIN